LNLIFNDLFGEEISGSNKNTNIETTPEHALFFAPLRRGEDIENQYNIT
jgi:hypothetical protein